MTALKYYKSQVKAIGLSIYSTVAAQVKSVYMCVLMCTNVHVHVWKENGDYLAIVRK